MARDGAYLLLSDQTSWTAEQLWHYSATSALEMIEAAIVSRLDCGPDDIE
jgi:hypothetical protein